MRYQLCKGEVLTLEADGAIDSITVTSGAVWLTRSDDTRDYCLEAGDRLPVRNSGKLILEAFSPATLALNCNQSRAGLRITLTWPTMPRPGAVTSAGCAR